MQTNLNVRVIKSMAKHVASKSDVRRYLCGVAVQYRDDGVYYVATDGHMCAAYREAYTPAADVEQKGAGTAKPDTLVTFIIPRASLDGVKLKKHGPAYLPATLHDIKEERPARVTVTNGSSITFDTIDGRFPDWDRIIPYADGDESPAQFNPDLLASLKACYADINAYHTDCMALSPRGNGGALYCGEDDNFVGVVMPMRVTFTAPSWVHAAPPKDKKAA